MAKERRSSWFKVFLHQKALIDSVPDETAGKALKAALYYFETQETLELDQLTLAVFSSLKQYIDESFVDFENSSKKNRNNVNKRWHKDIQHDTTDTSGTSGTTGIKSIQVVPLDTTYTEAEAEAEAEAEEYKGSIKIDPLCNRRDRMVCATAPTTHTETSVLPNDPVTPEQEAENERLRKAAMDKLRGWQG